jgi:hypothetical protein
VKLQEKTGIPVSPVFNNIYVPNDRATLQVFVRNFARLHDMGVRNVTIPHILWMHMGDFKKTYPEVTIKNTLLRRVRSGQDFWLHAEAGYDYVNLDTPLVRDESALKEIRAAQATFFEKTGKYVKTSLLTGIGCHGTCPFWEEHHQHTLTNPEINTDPVRNLEVFRYPQEFSCNYTTERETLSLVSASLPYFREDFMNMAAWFDIVKLPGRRAFQSLGDALTTIAALRRSEDVFVLNPPDIVRWAYENPAMAGKALLRWRSAIKNCRFQCWNCAVCTRLASAYVLRDSNIVSQEQPQ